MTYAEQLRDPRWQRKRLEVLSAAGWRCQRCTADLTTLHVHHKKYRSGVYAWQYENDELEVLCEDCHEAEHKIDRQPTAAQLRRRYFLNPDPAFESERARQLAEIRRRMAA